MAKIENPYDERDVMLMILLAASRLGRETSFGELWNLVFVDNLISYFDYCICLDKLVKNKLMRRYENDMYQITPEGRETCGILEDMIPRKIKPLIEKSTREQKDLDRREACLTTEIKEHGQEYMVTLGLDDDVDCVFRLTMVAPNMESAEKMKTLFRKNPEAVFFDILAAVFKERDKNPAE